MNHLSMLSKDLPEECDVQASDISPWLIGDTSALFRYTGADNVSRAVNLHGFKRGMCEDIADSLSSTTILNKIHLYRVLNSTQTLQEVA